MQRERMRARRPKSRGYGRCLLLCLVILALTPSVYFLRRVMTAPDTDKAHRRKPVSESSSQALLDQIARLNSEVSTLKKQNAELKIKVNSANAKQAFPALAAGGSLRSSSHTGHFPPNVNGLPQLNVEDMLGPSGNASEDTSLVKDIIGSSMVPNFAAMSRADRQEWKDIVLGMCSGIQAPYLAIFVKSLRKYSECRVVLFLDGPTAEKSKDLLEEYNITKIVFTPSTMDPEFLRGMHPSSYRWHLIYDYLKKEIKDGVEIRNILLADVRDTAFEGNPFDLVARPGIHVFGEDKQIMSDEWNSGWIASCFGIAKSQELSYNDVICSGIVLGTGRAMLKYLDIFANVIESKQFRACERNGVDQGVHNVLVHTNRALQPILNLHSQATGKVAHMQAEIMQADTPGYIVRNTYQQPAIIVHQYDRNLHLQARYLSEYAKDLMQATGSTQGNGTCAGYNFSVNAEEYKGVGDINPGDIPSRAETVQECCQMCNDNSRCTAFTYFTKSFQCWLKDTSGVVEGSVQSVYVPDVITGRRGQRLSDFDPYALVRANRYSKYRERLKEKDYEKMGYPPKRSSYPQHSSSSSYSKYRSSLKGGNHYLRTHGNLHVATGLRPSNP